MKSPKLPEVFSYKMIPPLRRLYVPQILLYSSRMHFFWVSSEFCACGISRIWSAVFFKNCASDSPYTSTSSRYSSHTMLTNPTKTFIAIWRKKNDPAPFNPIGTLHHWNISRRQMNAVNTRASFANPNWWYPAVKFMLPKYFGLRRPTRSIICLMFGRGHVSTYSVASLRRLKSRQKRRDGSSGFFFTISTWLYSVLNENSITPRAIRSFT
jgi:hypothetical protein